MGSLVVASKNTVEIEREVQTEKNGQVVANYSIKAAH
jgi:hypothetical protein